MRVALAAGGTGGHIIPAITVWEALRVLQPEAEARFFGPEERGERSFVERAGLPFERVPAAPIRGRRPAALARNLLTIAQGTAIAVMALRRFDPHVVLSTGGYGSFPTALAARLLRRPLVVFLPDVEPGLAVRVERWLATRIATATEGALRHLPARKTKVTGYPVRSVFFTHDRRSARLALGIPQEERVLVVAGATQGAQAINRAVFAGLRTLCEAAIVVHITGARDAEAAQSAKTALPPELGERYLPYAYRDDLPVVMRAADLGVMRAGASVLGELPAAALPAVLVPGTYAGGHQRANARWLAGAGAAVIVEEREIERLVPTVVALLEDAERRAAMSSAAERLARPEAAQAIAQVVLEVARR